MGFSQENHKKNMLRTLKKIDIRDINQGLTKYNLKLSTKLEGLEYRTLVKVYSHALKENQERIEAESEN